MIEAEQFKAGQTNPFGVVNEPGQGRAFVVTPSGEAVLNDGDWVIKGSQPNDFYPCAASVFAAQFDPVEPESVPA